MHPRTQSRTHVITHAQTQAHRYESRRYACTYKAMCIHMHRHTRTCIHTCTHVHTHCPPKQGPVKNSLPAFPLSAPRAGGTQEPCPARSYQGCVPPAQAAWPIISEGCSPHGPQVHPLGPSARRAVIPADRKDWLQAVATVLGHSFKLTKCTLSSGGWYYNPQGLALSKTALGEGAASTAGPGSPGRRGYAGRRAQGAGLVTHAHVPDCEPQTCFAP